jgi:hypothetical protein
VLAVWIAVTSAAAQDNASLAGVVRDEAGMVIADAEVTVTNRTAEPSRATKTDFDGTYRFTGLPPGTYTLTISAVPQGFKAFEAKNITLRADFAARADAVLKVGKLTNIDNFGVRKIDDTSPGTRSGGISVRLIQPQHGFGAKGSLPLRVDITNEGNETLLVCRNLAYDHFCSWAFEIHDSAGHAVPLWAFAGDSIVGSPAPFANALISNWIALAPHDTYGTTIDLGLVLGPHPRAGRYEVKVTFSSDGPDSQSVYNDLLHYPQELAALPYPGWKGTAQSNSVSVEIVASK